MASKKPEKWIGAMNGGKGPKKGALHEALGVPKGDKIPKGKIEQAASKGGKVGKEARLAETFAEMRKKGGKKKPSC